MENAFSRLLKVLSLERKQGYRNKAVIGGLDKFASRWEADARATSGSPALIGEIVALLIGYPSVEDPNARERIVDQIVRRAREAEAMVDGAPLEAPVRGSEGAGHPSRRPATEVPEEGPDQAAGPEQRAEGLGAPPAVSRPSQGPSPRAAETGKPAPKTPSLEGESQQREGAPPRNKPALTKPERGTPLAATAVDTNLKQAGSQAPDAPGSRAAIGMTPASAPAAIEALPAAEEDQPAHDVPGGAEEPALPEEQAPAPLPAEPVGDADSLEGWLGTSSKPERRADLGSEPARPAPPRVPNRPVPVKEFPRSIATEEAAFDQEMHDQGEWQAGPGDAGNEEQAVAAMRRRSTPESAGGHGLDAPVTRLPSIGPSFADKLAKLGVHTVRDLLYLLPRRYDDYSLLLTIDQLHYGEEVTIVGTVWQLSNRVLNENRRMVTAVVGDGTGEIQMTWFNPFVERQLHTGRAYVFSGKVDSYRGQLQMRNPVFEPLDSVQINTGRLVPVYPLTQGLSGRWLRKVIKNAVDSWAVSVPDLLPASVRQEWDLLPLGAALEEIHFPENNELLAAARRRLSFDEFFILQLGVLSSRQRFRSLSAQPLQTDADLLASFLRGLPFSLTSAQERVLGEIARDLACQEPMSRLLQGDVGSGKTAVAAAALWAAVANGAQGAIMAPTEILAEQHARSFAKLFAGLTRPGDGQPVQVSLLTGRQRKSEREAALQALAEGQIDIAVGTHALIQEDVSFRDLAVTVVDEQHRFGVEQRAALRQKGSQPHMLVMSATPIPRSLALTVFGDLDVSVIDEMPAGRTPIKTKWLTSTYRERAYNFVRRQVAAGHQAFIIYPLVEESETSEAKAAVEEHARLQANVFPNLRLGLLHGRLRGDDKDAVMRAFAAGELDVLVATSVVEVGIDVPNATVIVIEGAERFGLAQLHQFRGRVGRGAFASYCVLISDAGEGESVQRLQALETNNDGFALAQIDLELRGPGDFLGTRQSGLPPLQLAQLSDLRTLENARSAAQKIFEEDPQLALPEHRALAERVAEFWHGAGDVS